MDTDISHVSGNASDEIKRAIADPTKRLFCIDGDPAKGTGYSHAVAKQMVFTEVSILRNPEDPKAKEVGRVVCELVVNDGA
ncbi:hypothetical protein VNI00_009083 [Paramarasmius palmivorus]|uniref:Uncharacterized protein n=1 Tax=Paramarasmius palmivorus TaxID=297713 RepID=A0AAW0CRG6_9AGAR